MANSPDFVTHALDLLAPVGPVTARAMFGGHAVYARGLLFALLDDDELFLKADDLARPRFEEGGCRQWSYPGPKGPTPGPYWRPPDEAHEDPEAMLPWAALALEAAARKAAAKGGKKAKGRPAPGGSARGARPVRATAKGRPAPKASKGRPAAAGRKARTAPGRRQPPARRGR